MKLTVLQPTYFPAIDQIGKIMAADVVVWADTFPFHKHGNINRTRIKTITGQKWLTIPVFSQQKPINKVIIDQHEDWMSRHLRSIEHNYKNAAYYYQMDQELTNLLSGQPESLEKFIYDCFTWTLRRLRLDINIVRASELDKVKDRNERVVAWCRQQKCDEYLLEAHEVPLLDTEGIVNQGVNMGQVSVKPIYYFQQYSEFYFPLSVLDILFNEGEMAGNMIKQNIKLVDL